MISATQWMQVFTACGVRRETAAAWAPLWERHVQPDRFSLGAREIDDFVGQVLHETARLEHLVENLNYNPQRLMAVWPKRFPSLQVATPLAWNPQGLANSVYGGRMGNTAPNDGWKYRGRGIPMCTGKDNYALLQKLTALPLLDQPELLEQPAVALRCGVLWWEGRVPDSAIDSIERTTRAVQGGQLALDDRKWLTTKAGSVLASFG